MTQKTLINFGLRDKRRKEGGIDMRMEITEKQAMKMANNIYGSNFRCYGVGNFDLSVEEFARLLMRFLTMTIKKIIIAV